MPNADELKGRAKEAAGAATGDGSLKNEGRADQAAGKVEKAADAAKEKVSEAVDKLEEKSGRD